MTEQHFDECNHQYKNHHCVKCGEWDIEAELGELNQRLDQEIREARLKALKALAGYKFLMFGYWAGVWVHLNRVEGRRRPSPFRDFVKLAREKLK